MSGIKSSSSEETLRLALRIFLGVLLLAPYLIWLWRVPEWSFPEGEEWWDAFLTAALQASLSSVLSLLAGWFLFLCLQSWSGKARGLAELSLLLPNMIPPLFIALGMMNLIVPFVAFPYGLGAVVAAHVFLNGGLVAIGLDRLIHNKLGGMAETAWVLGSGRALFWRKVGWPFLRGDLGCLFLFVFSVCFTSFSLPLLLSGERTVTLEVAIYDFIRMDGRWDKAVLLAAFQSFVLFAAAMLLPHPFWPPRPTRHHLEFLSYPGLRAFVFLPAGLIVCGWLLGLSMGLRAPWDQEVLLQLPEALVTTVAIGLAVGLLHLVMFLLIAFVSPHARLRRFLNGYLCPSAVITGFALLLVPGEGDTLNILKVIVALTLISLPLLYRWIVHSALSAVDGQVTVARTLGASWADILFDVVWPQIGLTVLRACGIAAIWACGDFALTGILAGDVPTLPLVMEGLIGNYRMELAQVLMLPLVAIGLGLYYGFVSVAKYVTR